MKVQLKPPTCSIFSIIFCCSTLCINLQSIISRHRKLRVIVSNKKYKYIFLIGLSLYAYLSSTFYTVSVIFYISTCHRYNIILDFIVIRNIYCKISKRFENVSDFFFLPLQIDHYKISVFRF